MSTVETGECSKCMSEIPLEADRCPECGYEPIIGMLGGTGMWVSLMLGSTTLVIALSSLLVTLDGYPVQDALLMFGIFAFFSLLFFGYIYQQIQVSKSKPAQPVEAIGSKHASKSWTESIEDGYERGEGWRRKIDYAPDWVFTSIIVTGVMLSLSVWVVGALELETAMIVSLIAGLAVLGMGVTMDVERVNRVHETGFRWWFHGVLSVIPLIGWVFALNWIRRRRTVTGN